MVGLPPVGRDGEAKDKMNSAKLEVGLGLKLAKSCSIIWVLFSMGSINSDSIKALVTKISVHLFENDTNST